MINKTPGALVGYGLVFCFTTALPSAPASGSSRSWSTKLDGEVRFYQTTEMGALVAGSEKSLYAIDGETGEVLWRRKNVRLDETDVAPIVGTDLLLLSVEKDERTRLEAVDLFTGRVVWKGDKVKGSVMHVAVDLENDLAAVVLARDAEGRARQRLERRPTVHVIDLATGRVLWKRDLETEVEMMPVRWGEDEDRKTAFTLDNYRAPLFLDNRLYLFYEGVSSFDARSGKERIRERFRVNEEGMALTEADPAIDYRHVYVSGRGRVRAISRASGRIVWEAKDLGLTPELIPANGVILVRTGGQFTRLKDGDVVGRGPYGISAIDAASGRILWRYRGADKGITNIALPDDSSAICADRDDLIMVDAATGQPRKRVKHKIDRAAFVLVNESGHAVVGSRSELAAFGVRGNMETAAFWRVRHEPPGRGVLRTVAAIAARSAALYFRFGGAATTAFRGVQSARGLSTLRWSGLATRATLPSLTDYAAEAAREHVSSTVKPYGIASRVQRARSAVGTIRDPRIAIGIDEVDVGERLLDRLDPARQLDKLSRFLWRRQRLAVLKGLHMYYYTDLRKGGRGLAGVNVNTGMSERAIALEEPDYRLQTDEVAGFLYSAHDDRLNAYRLNDGER